MNERCPACGLIFGREHGYFLGAMYISYGLALLTIAIFGSIVWALTGWSPLKSATVAVLLFLPLVPMLTLFSRVLWIYLDQTIDPDNT
jgi:hypothetical protein